MTGPETHTAALSFHPAVENLRRVRSFVRRSLPADFPHGDAVLVANLLAKNAIEHASTGFEVVVSYSESEVTVSVEDGQAAQDVAESLRERPGMGGTMLAFIADAWGVDELPSGKRVWVSLTRVRRR